MSDCHSSDSPMGGHGQSLSFTRTTSPCRRAAFAGIDSDSESGELPDYFANVGGVDFSYVVHEAHPSRSASPRYAPIPANSFGSLAEDSFAQPLAETGACIAAAALFPQESALSSRLASLQVNAGTSAAHAAHASALPQPSEVPSSGCHPHALQPNLYQPQIGLFFAPSAKALLCGSSTAHAEVLSMHMLPQPGCRPARNRVVQQRLDDPLGRADDIFTSSPTSRSQVDGARASASELQRQHDCTGFKWSLKIKFSTKVDHRLVNFGTQNLAHTKNVVVNLTVQNMVSFMRGQVTFRGRLFNSNKKRPGADFLILQFKDIHNDDLPHVNAAARHVRQFVDAAVRKEAEDSCTAPCRPTYQLLFQGTSQYKHSLLPADFCLSLFESACKASPVLQLQEGDFKRAKGQNPFPISLKGQGFTVEVYPQKFKVTERYEDQDMAAPLVHKHKPFVAELNRIIDQLCQSGAQAGHGLCPSQRGGCAAGGGGLPEQPALLPCDQHEDDLWNLFQQPHADGSDSMSEDEDDYGQAPDRDDDDFAHPVCSGQRYRGC